MQINGRRCYMYIHSYNAHQVICTYMLTRALINRCVYIHIYVYHLTHHSCMCICVTSFAIVVVLVVVGVRFLPASPADMPTAQYQFAYGGESPMPTESHSVLHNVKAIVSRMGVRGQKRPKQAGASAHNVDALVAQSVHHALQAAAQRYGSPPMGAQMMGFPHGGTQAGGLPGLLTFRRTPMRLPSSDGSYSEHGSGASGEADTRLGGPLALTDGQRAKTPASSPRAAGGGLEFVAGCAGAERTGGDGSRPEEAPDVDRMEAAMLAGATNRGRKPKGPKVGEEDGESEGGLPEPAPKAKGKGKAKAKAKAKGKGRGKGKAKGKGKAEGKAKAKAGPIITISAPHPHPPNLHRIVLPASLPYHLYSNAPPHPCV